MTSLGDRTVYDSEVFRISTKRHMKRIIFMCLLIVFSLHLRAEMICDSVKIYFWKRRVCLTPSGTRDLTPLGKI